MLINTTQPSSFSKLITILYANSHQTPIHTTTPQKHRATSLPQPLHYPSLLSLSSLSNRILKSPSHQVTKLFCCVVALLFSASVPEPFSKRQKMQKLRAIKKPLLKRLNLGNKKA